MSGFDPWMLPVQSGDGVAESPRARVTKLGGVSPLDRQFGVWPKKSLPERLYETVLGNGTEGFALVDAALIPDLGERLAKSRLLSACLFDGTAAGKLGSVAPWLVQLNEDDDLTRNLFTRGLPHHSLWDSGAAVFVRSSLSFGEVRHNFRKLTQVQTEDGAWLFLRFWNPLLARYLLEFGSPEIGLRLLANGAMMMRGAEPDSFWVWHHEGAAHEIDHRQMPPVRLQKQDLHALQLAKMDEFATRVRDWLTQAYGPLPTNISATRFVLELADHAKTRFGLRSERVVSDYIAASWLLREPAERRLDFAPLTHEIPQATLSRIHATAFRLTRREFQESIG